jgi:hypothetical protein
VELQRVWKDSKSKGQMPFKKLAFINRLYLKRSNTSERVLTSCLELSQPLKGLKIIANSSSEEMKSILQKILEKNSKTLETLAIGTDYHYNFPLPVLPRLTRLKLRNRAVFNLREQFMVIQIILVLK